MTSLLKDPSVAFFLSKALWTWHSKPSGSGHKDIHLPPLLHSAIINPHRTTYSSPSLSLSLPFSLLHLLLLSHPALHMLFRARNILCPLLSIHRANLNRSLGVHLVPTRFPPFLYADRYTIAPPVPASSPPETTEDVVCILPAPTPCDELLDKLLASVFNTQHRTGHFVGTE